MVHSLIPTTYRTSKVFFLLLQSSTNPIHNDQLFYPGFFVGKSGLSRRYSLHIHN